MRTGGWIGMIFMSTACAPHLYTDGAIDDTDPWTAPENSWPVGTPPSDLVGGGMQFDRTVGTDTHRIGYKRDPDRTGLNPGDPNWAMVGQCYPRATLDGQKLKHVDMMKMKSVLRN